jgi:hypothetical protein
VSEFQAIQSCTVSACFSAAFVFNSAAARCRRRCKSRQSHSCSGISSRRSSMRSLCCASECGSAVLVAPVLFVCPASHDSCTEGGGALHCTARHGTAQMGEEMDTRGAIPHICAGQGRPGQARATPAQTRADPFPWTRGDRGTGAHGLRTLDVRTRNHQTRGARQSSTESLILPPSSSLCSRVRDRVSPKSRGTGRRGWLVDWLKKPSTG